MGSHYYLPYCQVGYANQFMKNQKILGLGIVFNFKITSTDGSI